jgi:hypothetical protein
MPSETSAWTPSGDALDEVNRDFHGAYDHAREELGEATPALILLGDLLVLRWGERREEAVINPPQFHRLRSAAHAPVALFLAAIEPSMERIARLRSQVNDSLVELETATDSREIREDVRRVLLRTLQQAERLLAHPDSLKIDAVRDFARVSGPDILKLTEHAVEIQLSSLHANTDRLLSGLSEKALAGLEVVVAGAHQARDRSAGMQYFRARLAEPLNHEERVTYAENVSDEAGALRLLRTRRVDRLVAGAFFQDAKRLQRDVLGDAAASKVKAMQGWLRAK